MAAGKRSTTIQPATTGVFRDRTVETRIFRLYRKPQQPVPKTRDQGKTGEPDYAERDQSVVPGVNAPMGIRWFYNRRPLERNLRDHTQWTILRHLSRSAGGERHVAITGRVTPQF